MKRLLAGVLSVTLIIGGVLYLQPGFAYAATPAFVQGTTGQGGSNANPINFSFSSSVTTGDTIVVGVAVSDIITVSSITDSAGNTYTLGVSKEDTSGTGTWDYEFYALNVTGGSLTIHINTSSTGWDYTFAAQEFSGIGSLDVSNSLLISSFASTQSGAAVTTTASNDMVVPYFMEGTTATFSLGSGYTNLTYLSGSNSFYTVGLESKVDGTAGSVTPTIGSGSTGFGGVALTLAFKASGGGSNSCTYSGSGDWTILATDNCYITGNTYVTGTCYFTGTGNIGLAGTISCSGFPQIGPNVNVNLKQGGGIIYVR